MVDMPDRRAQPAAAANPAPAADTTATPDAARMPAPPTAIETSHQSETTDVNEKGGAPDATAMAARPDRAPHFGSPADVAGIDVSDGLIAVSFTPGADGAALTAIDFAPGSATLPPDATARLESYLAEVKGPDVHIRVIGDADTPALALDRALAVGLALVQRGIPADRLELTLAPDLAGDQVRLSVVATAP
jgi:outer membrane protein OmpA-like peptidoglycan-associated protein